MPTQSNIKTRELKKYKSYFIALQDSDSEEEELNTTHKHGGGKLLSRGGRT